MGGPNLKLPLVIKSSPKAVMGKFFIKIIIWLVALILTLFIPFVEINILIWFGLFVVLVYGLVRFGIEYLRIKNTTYTLYRNKIEASSYLFKFLGAYNNAVTLTQIRQIQAYSNTYLDIWFFNCGGVTLTVSGDLPDFKLENVYAPGEVKRTIEKICFGKKAVTTVPPHVGEIE